MTIQRPDYSEICAYVDGELDAEAAAHVAYAAMRDPATAAQIAQLTKLKSLTPGIVPEVQFDGLERDGAKKALLHRARIRRKSMMAAAAAVAGLVVAGTMGALATWRASPPGAFNASVAVHRAWSGTVGAPQADRGETRPAARTGNGFTAPDLSAAQLRLSTAESFETSSVNILHFGYVGTRGCRLSLFVGLKPAAPLPKDSDVPGLRTAAWLQGGVGYLVIADGMDEQHFQTVALALRQYSIDRAPFGRPVEDLLAESRLHSKPCPV